MSGQHRASDYKFRVSRLDNEKAHASFFKRSADTRMLAYGSTLQNVSNLSITNVILYFLKSGISREIRPSLKVD